LGAEKKNKIISYCFKIRKRFYLVPRLYELSIKDANVAQAGDTLLYNINGLDLSLEERFLKRTFDIIISLFVLLIFGPLLLIIALIIKLYDKGPVFFRQERITKYNKKFLLYKFRSMIPNAEENTGPVQASKNDPRITSIGKFIRKTRIDELPQVINVLKGDMSIVGPRALRVEEVEDFIKKNPEFSYRSNVKAGITGYAQTMGTYTTSFTDKLKFDIYYITNYSFLNDFIILLHTVRSVFDPDSSRGLSEDLSLEASLEEQGFFIFRTTDDFIKIVIRK
jgi:exopolysaccharide biosynthesis polyprenyl glycosylphosphotransferase